MSYGARTYLLLVLVIPIFVCANNLSPEKCVAIASDADRLSCYDSLFKQTSSSIKEDDQLISSQQATSLVPENFGLKEKITHENVETITDKVASFTNLTNGRMKINLENGQTWVTNEALGRIRIKQQTNISITESRFGGYVLKAKDQKGFVRVKRIK